MAIAPNMFGIDPMSYQQQQNKQDFNQAVQYASLDPFQRATASMYQGATQLGRAAQGMFGMEDPQITASKEAQTLMGQFDPTTSEGLKGLSLALMQRAQATNSPVLAGLAQQAAAQYQKAILNEATVEQKTREKTPAIGEKVNQALYADALRRAGGDPIKAAQIYDAEELAKRKSVAASGVAPAPGQVPLTVLGQAQDIADKYTAKSKARLDNIGGIVAIANQVKTNPTALPQFKRELVKLAGDSQIGQNEVKSILGSEGLGADVVDAVNTFLTGAPTDVKIDKVLEGVKAIEKYTAGQYETGRQKARKVLAQGKIDPETQAAVLPDPYGVKKSSPGAAPSLSEFLAKAKVANPNSTEADLTAYYNTKYGKK